MVVSKDEVVSAVKENRREFIGVVLEEFGFKLDGPFSPYSTSAKGLVATVLNAAQEMACRKQLDDGFAQEIIARTARTVNLFPFIQSVLEYTGIDGQYFNTDAIPDATIVSLTENDISIAGPIGDLDERAFGSMLAFTMTGDIKKLSVEFNSPIIQRVFTSKMLPMSVLFEYMVRYQREVWGFDLARIFGLI